MAALPNRRYPTPRVAVAQTACGMRVNMRASLRTSDCRLIMITRLRRASERFRIRVAQRVGSIFSLVETRAEPARICLVRWLHTCTSMVARAKIPFFARLTWVTRRDLAWRRRGAHRTFGPRARCAQERRRLAPGFGAVQRERHGPRGRRRVHHANPAAACRATGGGVITYAPCWSCMENH